MDSESSVATSPAPEQRVVRQQRSIVFPVPDLRRRAESKVWWEFMRRNVWKVMKEQMANGEELGSIVFIHPDMIPVQARGGFQPVEPLAKEGHAEQSQPEGGSPGR